MEGKDLLAAGDSAGLIGLGVGILVGAAAIATGYSQGKIGSALMAAIAERPELEKRALFYMVLPESILIISVGIAYLLLSKI